MSETTLGPWFGAAYAGACGSCGDPIEEGDRIRADGHGSYLCEDCGEHEQAREEERTADWQAQASAAAKRHIAASLPTAEDFLGGGSPAPELPTAEEFLDGPDERLNVSGQPPARYEFRGSVNMGYLVTDPEAGDFRRYKNGKPKGMTRATTFNKAASDNKAIGDWGKRNVAIGAALRPDIIRRAHGKTHEADKRELDGIVAQLEEAAGAKVSANEGTFLHEFTEQMDAGLKTWRDAPEAYQQSLKLYAEALERAGLEPVPGLIERTTMIREFGGVVGTLDRIMYHRPSGRYVIVDLKTGKTMEYSVEETETQEWIYAHGVNQNGIYDWNDDTWSREDPSRGGLIATISEEVGIIIHMPVQGPDAGTVTLLYADLRAGARHAHLCHAIRSREKRKVVEFDGSQLQPLMTVPELPNVTPDAVWEHMFRMIRTKEEGAELYVRARDADLPVELLARLVRIGKGALQDPEPPF